MKGTTTHPEPAFKDAPSPWLHYCTFIYRQRITRICAAINLLIDVWHPPHTHTHKQHNLNYIFIIFLSPNSPQECSHPFVPPLPAIHAYCSLCFPAIVTTRLPDAHKMGLSGKTFAPHISHKGSLWPITVLMEARDSHQLHAFFPSHVWTPAKAQLALLAWCCLWQWHYRCPEQWHIVAHIINTG